MNKEEIEKIDKALKYANEYKEYLEDNHKAIYKDCGYEYYDLKEIEQDHKETNATLMSELAKMKEENERLKAQLFKSVNNTNNSMELTEDYKSRCEKASDKLSFIDEALENDTLNVPLCITKINSALNILQNGSDDNE